MTVRSSDAGKSGKARTLMRRLLLGVIGLLYLFSIPWYREPGSTPEIWLGLPDWVAVALLCYVGVAVLNACAWLLADVPEPDEDRDVS